LPDILVFCFVQLGTAYIYEMYEKVTAIHCCLNRNLQEMIFVYICISFKKDYKESFFLDIWEFEDMCRKTRAFKIYENVTSKQCSVNHNNNKILQNSFTFVWAKKKTVWYRLFYYLNKWLQFSYKTKEPLGSDNGVLSKYLL
jgi:hypothetical protein